MFKKIYGIFAFVVINLWSIIQYSHFFKLSSLNKNKGYYFLVNDNNYEIHKEISQIMMYKTPISECHQIKSFDLIKLTESNEWIFDINNYHIQIALKELNKQYGIMYIIHFDDRLENMKNGGLKIVPSFFKTSINIEFC